MDERTRKCNKCGEVKTFDHFHKDKQKHSGVRPICKTCVAEYMRQRYACRSAEARQAWNDYQRRKYQETRTMPKAKKQEKRELTFVEAQFEEVRQFLAEMAIRVEDLAIEIGSIADGEAVDQYDEEVIASDEEKETAQDISDQLYDLLEALSGIVVPEETAGDVAPDNAKYDEYGYPVAQSAS